MERKDFINYDPVSKTIRNGLIPTEYTLKNIEETGVLVSDEYRAEVRNVLKKIMDAPCISFIHEGIGMPKCICSIWLYRFL